MWRTDTQQKHSVQVQLRQEIPRPGRCVHAIQSKTFGQISTHKKSLKYNAYDIKTVKNQNLSETSMDTIEQPLGTLNLHKVNRKRKG